MRVTLAAAGLLTLVSLDAGPMIHAGSPQPPIERVLFIGNSLTYANNLPAMIEAVAAQSGLGNRLTCRVTALPDFSLEDHWKDGRAVRAIQDGHWTTIVLQQGPSSLPESEVVLRDYTKRFAAEARRRGARIALFGVWPSKARAASFDAVTTSYAHAAGDVQGLLVAVGEGWRAAWRLDPSLPLYGPDGFHPSPMGTYLGALMFFERLTGRSPIGLPGPDSSKGRALRAVRVEAAQLAILQQAAAEANARSAADQQVGGRGATAAPHAHLRYPPPGW